jgi:iron complex transport system ATP-binding protein
VSSVTSSPSVLSARDLDVRIGSRQVLNGIGFDLPAGAWWCVCGPNGSGKSTLLRTLAGLQAHAGHLSLLGQPLQVVSPLQRARHLSWMGQAQPVPQDLTVRDVARLGRWPHETGGASDSASGEAVVRQVLSDLSLLDLADRTLGQLSGGECQRALLARALTGQARVLLLDEPLNHLDLPHQQACLQSLRRACAGGTAVITVMHELHHALAADGLLVMKQGRLLHQGQPGEASTREALQEAFGMRLSFHAIDTHGTAPRWVVLPNPLS